MKEERLHELERKRFQGGLSRDEADELGRLMAEKAGKPYSNADERQHPDALSGGGPNQPYAGEEPYSEVQAKEQREHPDVHEAQEEEQAS
jgi:hypothetical protein